MAQHSNKAPRVICGGFGTGGKPELGYLVLRYRDNRDRRIKTVTAPTREMALKMRKRILQDSDWLDHHEIQVWDGPCRAAKGRNALERATEADARADVLFKKRWAKGWRPKWMREA